MKILLNWVLAAVAIIIAAYILPGVGVDGLVTALVLAVVLGAINAFIKPILVLLTLPLTMLTFGLFLFVINAALVLVAAAVVPGFTVEGFWYALLFSVVVSIVGAVLQGFGGPSEPALR